ncbi:hypothetical protein CLSAP_03670 [Clostridium saccharoperbutylacetonicum]|nr:hypothetical protein CLSAP_03670 [Clostridium saccharoperbutylacetonicum]NSB34503.1 hypothetical protein [Clostridium saccharoperbutylacetonicum]
MNFRENLLLIIIFSGMIIQSIYQYFSINNPSFKPYVTFNKSYNTNPIYYSRFCIYSLIASIAFLLVTICIKIELLLTSYLVLLAILAIPSFIFFIKLKYIRE